MPKAWQRSYSFGTGVGLLHMLVSTPKDILIRICGSSALLISRGRSRNCCSMKRLHFQGLTKILSSSVFIRVWSRLIAYAGDPSTSKLTRENFAMYGRRSNKTVISVSVEEDPKLKRSEHKCQRTWK